MKAYDVASSRQFQLLLVGLVLLLSTGCDRGVPLVSVTGTVQIDGKPYEGAIIEFQPAGGSPSYGKTDSSGAYVLRFSRDREGAMVGEHTVRVRTEGLVTDADGNERPVRELLPKKYHDNSELIRQVVDGENQLDFQLQSDPKLVKGRVKKRVQY